ncbi:MAG: hypothetical protein HY763_07935 [Planctomycetes bacterium]|nr:hypothetical protein [Planctomycetota bacterium]
MGWHRRTIAIGACVGSVLAGGVLARGSPITWTFGGEITYVSDDLDLLGGQVSAGTPYSSLFTFASDTPDSLPNDPTLGLYADALLSIRGNVGPVQFTGPFGSTNEIRVRNDSDDSLRLRGGVSFVGSGQVFQVFMALGSADGQPFTTDGLPFFPPNLGDFYSYAFRIFDPTQTVPLSLIGRLDFLVPEPATLVIGLIGVVATVMGPLRRRRLRRSAGIAATSVPCVCVAVMLIDSGFALAFTDCNQNGVDDSLDLTGCTAAQLVRIFDTSGSMDPRTESLCRDFDGAIADLTVAGIPVLSESFGISEPCEYCCTDSVAQHPDLGYTADGFPNVEVLGACTSGLEPDDDIREDWGPATAIVAANYEWSPGTRRMVIVLSDEGPRCGGTAPSDPGPDRDAITHAIEVVSAQDVVVGAVAKLPVFASLAGDLATGGAPGG